MYTDRLDIDIREFDSREMIAQEMEPQGVFVILFIQIRYLFLNNYNN